MKPTPYEDVNEILAALMAGVKAVAGQKLVGMYLYGSAATEGYDPSCSDVDVLTAVATDIDEAEFEDLRTMHDALARTRHKWDDRIEVQYLPLVTLRTFKTQSRTVPVISPGEPFHWREVDREWTMNWYDVQENGVTLLGPDPRTLIDRISQAEFVESVRAHAAQWREHIQVVSRNRGSQAYAVLTMCRATFTCETGQQVSKERAAHWAKGALPEWAPVIQRALERRLDAPRRGEPEDETTLSETSAFVDFVIDRTRSR